MLKKNIDSHSLKFLMRIHFMSQHFYHTKHVNHERSNEINLKGGKRTSAKSYEREEKDHYIPAGLCFGRFFDRAGRLRDGQQCAAGEHVPADQQRRAGWL